MNRRVLVIGLVSAPEEIVFERQDELPNLGRLINGGVYGRLKGDSEKIA